MTAQMLVVLNSILSFAKKNGLCINVKPSFYVSCVNFKCLFEWLWVWKVLLILIFHFIKPMMRTEDVCLRNGQVMPLISREADGAQWLQSASVCLGTRLKPSKLGLRTWEVSIAQDKESHMARKSRGSVDQLVALWPPFAFWALFLFGS